MTVDYPGVVVTEATAGAIPVVRRGFRAIKVTGTSKRGPAGLNRNPLSRESQYIDIYGDPDSTGYSGDAMKYIFTNVDQAPVFYNRIVGAGAVKATKTLNAAAVPTLRVDSKGPGADYNYVLTPAAGVSVTYVGGDLNVYDKGVLKEQWHNVLALGGPYSAQAAADLVNAGSNLIDLTWLSTAANPDDAATPQGLLTGADGAAVVAADIAGDSGTKTGVWAFAEKELPLGFVIAPGYAQSAVGLALTGVAESFRHTAIVDSTLGTSQAGAITERNQYASPKGHLIYAYGWTQVIDSVSGARKFTPRSPFRAAHIVRSHSLPGAEANVGAGLDFVLRGAIGLEQGLMTDIEQGVLNVKGIDCARNFSAFGQGIVHWAARTVSTNPLYTFLQVRTIFNVIADSLEIGLRFYPFKPYDGRGRVSKEIKGSIEGLLWDMWNQGALFGGTASEAFLVKDVSSLNELDQGIVRFEAYVKPTPIIERLEVTLYRVPLAFNFQTGAVTIGAIASQA
jgi:phage tail sheath protein FI